MKFRRTIAGISAVVMALSAMSFSAFSTVSAEPANDVFDNLDQKQITQAMEPGWNVGNQLEATTTGTPNETAWQSTKITKELIQAVKAQGFKSVRIPISYLDYIGAGPDYTINADWLARIKEVVNYCVDEGLYAIINMHGDGYTTVYGGWMISKPRYTDKEINDSKTRVYYTDEEQVEINKKYGLVWEQIANTFKDYDEHLIYESMNEVFDGTYNTPDATIYNRINNYNQIFVDSVRKTGGNNAKRWLLIPGWNTDINYTVGDYGFVMPSDTNRDESIPAGEQRIMISVHYYAPWGFCGTETAKPGTTEPVDPNWGTDQEIKALKDQFARCYEKFVMEGYPVVIGEWGSIDKTQDNYKDNNPNGQLIYKGVPENKDSRIKFANEVCKAARSMSMIPVYWDNGWNGPNGFALFDRGTLEVTQQEIINSIMDAYKGEAEPAPEIIKPMDKDDALGVVYSSKTAVLASGIADASMAGAKQIRYVFDCASGVSFNQYSGYNFMATVAETYSEASVTGNSDVQGATNLTAVLDLVNPIKEGDSYNVSIFTASWANAKDYVLLIRRIEFLDADGKVIKTIDKSNKPSDNNNNNNNNNNNSNNNSNNNGNQTAKPGTTTPGNKVTTTAPKSNAKADAQKIVNNAKIKNLKATVKGKKVTVKWKKASKVTGYIVEVSANKKFKNLIAKKTLKKNSKKVTLKIKKLKKGKTYWVRVRAYKSYKANGKTNKATGSWKKVKFKVK